MRNVSPAVGRNTGPRDHFWMPFTANRRFNESPRMFVAASGMYFTTDDGKKVLDGSSGLWCVNAGHGRQHITEAVTRQLETLDFGPTFQLGHPRAFEFAERLANITPGHLDRVFFTNSGSEAVDTALKIALAYHRAAGDSYRTKLIGRSRGYHGVGFGGLSVSGLQGMRKAFARLPDVAHLRHTHDIQRNAFSRGQPEHGAELADDLEILVELHGGETIAAVIVEPVAGSTGILVPPKGYLERLRAITRRYGILLIFDEVITGFGRVGAPFASHRFNVLPDLITCAKGLTNGAVPMGAVFVDNDIFDMFMKGPTLAPELSHGYTYSGHPVACAAGLAALDIYEDERLFERARTLEEKMADAAFTVMGAPNVIDIRTIGLAAAIELAPRPGEVGARGAEALSRCLDRGVLIRISGDVINVAPPLIVTEEQIGHVFATVASVLSEIR